MVALWTNVHHQHMADQRHFLRQWRKHRGLTLEQVAERIGTTHATLSRIETFKLKFDEELLGLLADVYMTDRASLIMRDPSDPEGLWSIYDTLTPPQRRQAVAMMRVIKGDKTGTDDE